MRMVRGGTRWSCGDGFFEVSSEQNIFYSSSRRSIKICLQQLSNCDEAEQEIKDSQSPSGCHRQKQQLCLTSLFLYLTGGHLITPLRYYHPHLSFSKNNKAPFLQSTVSHVMMVLSPSYSISTNKANKFNCHYKQDIPMPELEQFKYKDETSFMADKVRAIQDERYQLETEIQKLKTVVEEVKDKKTNAALSTKNYEHILDRMKKDEEAVLFIEKDCEGRLGHT